jgi:membrane-bound lytic murein transglycosylase B
MNRNAGSWLALVLTAALATTVPFGVQADDSTAALQAQLQAIEDQIASDQQAITQAKGQANTLASAVSRLVKQQAVLELQIKASELRIGQTETRLSDTQAQITANLAREAELKDGIGETLQSLREAEDDPPLLAFIRTGDFFVAIDRARQESQLVDSLAAATSLADQLDATLQAQQVALVKVEDDARNLEQVKLIQQAAVAQAKGTQQALLAATKGKEQTYAASLADHKAQAAQIRQRIYDLLGVGTQVTFGDAVKMAQWVSGATGIRPAFLLSILSQESDLGANVGTCNRPGDPPSKGWKVVMKPDRDQGPFLQITGALGRDPDITPVSCPMHDARGNQIGWGGAMGPAQFIPSTWLGYAGKVSALTGHASDPWDIRDAFAASAIKLVADGAGSASGEWAAAMRYFSGGTDTRYRFYGDQVMARAAQYQKDIDQLSN